jgi:tyrosyl-tRNA synthetase
MGKSLNNYIAVFDPPKEKYGKVMSIPDNIILNYFYYATTLPEEEIEKIKKELESGTNPMLIKKRLAREIVTLYHSAEEAKEAEYAFEKQFSQREVPNDIPEFVVSKNSCKLSNLLVDSGICSTNGEAKRLIQGGAVSLNGEKITAFDAVVNLKDGDIIRAGKRNYIKIKKI